MIYLLYGKNSIHAREKLQSLLQSLLLKKPDASLFRVSSENFSEGEFENLISSQGLFEKKYIVVCDSLCDKEDAKKYILKNKKDIAESENIFIFIEGALDKKTVSSFEKVSEKVQLFEEKKVVKKERFNVFSLTEAFGRRDKKTLWTLYQKAKRENVSDEEIHGILFWQIKSMLLAKNASNAKEAKLNPFVYKKSLGFVKNYSSDELRDISSKFVSLYHDSRRGVHGFDTALEKAVLRI